MSDSVPLGEPELAETGTLVISGRPLNVAGLRRRSWLMALSVSPRTTSVTPTPIIAPSVTGPTPCEVWRVLRRLLELHWIPALAHDIRAAFWAGRRTKRSSVARSSGRQPCTSGQQGRNDPSGDRACSRRAVVDERLGRLSGRPRRRGTGVGTQPRTFPTVLVDCQNHKSSPFGLSLGMTPVDPPAVTDESQGLSWS